MTQPKDQSALKPCPFCNCSAYIVEGRDPIMGLDWFWATCQHIIDPHKGSKKPTYSEAIAAWNQRAEPDELARLRERVAVLEAINSLADDELEILKREWRDSVKAYHHHEPEVNWIAMPRIAAVYEGLLKALENRND